MRYFLTGRVFFSPDLPIYHKFMLSCYYFITMFFSSRVLIWGLWKNSKTAYHKFVEVGDPRNYVESWQTVHRKPSTLCGCLICFIFLIGQHFPPSLCANHKTEAQAGDMNGARIKRVKLEMKLLKWWNECSLVCVWIRDAQSQVAHQSNPFAQ